MATGSSLLDTLRTRGLLHQHTEGLAQHLAKGPTTAYCGFDPTAASLHVGNLVPVMALRRLAAAGHRVVAVVGGGTAMIGDPSGKSTERPLLGVDEVRANGDAIGAQLSRLVGGHVEMVNNSTWLDALGMIEFLRDVGKHFPINQMLAKDTVKSRLETGISYTEFSYMLLQAYDFLQLFTRSKVTLQVGGSDQWGNITAGTELIRRSAGGEAHALTTPLLLTSSGKKFGKSEGGAVWLDATRTSAFEFYQYWLTTDDADVLGFLRIFTDIDGDALAELERSVQTEPQLRRAQSVLAAEMTALVHGAESTGIQQSVSALLFGRGVDYRTLSDVAFQLAHKETGSLAPFEPEAGKDVNFVEMVATVLATSKGDARKLISQGAISINGQKVPVDTVTWPREGVIHNRWIVLKRGGQKIVVFELRG